MPNKFAELPVGRPFVYRGETYLKSGPLTGRNPATGEQRMIPRAALVEPTGEQAATARGAPETVSPETLRGALERFDERLRAGIAGLDGEEAGRLESVLGEARRRLLAELGLDG